MSIIIKVEVTEIDSFLLNWSGEKKDCTNGAGDVVLNRATKNMLFPARCKFTAVTAKGSVEDISIPVRKILFPVCGVQRT